MPRAALKSKNALRFVTIPLLAFGAFSPIHPRLSKLPSMVSDSTAGQFVVKIRHAKTDSLQSYERFVVAAKVFENEAEWLNTMIRLPKDIPIVFLECGKLNAFYSSRMGEIQICYEMLAHENKLFADEDAEERTESVRSATEFILYHEVGHALIDVLGIDTPGREEDVVDGLASYLLIGEGSDESLNAVINAARIFESFPGNMADEHSFGLQRVYQMLCYIYGSDPTAHSDFVGDDAKEDRYLVPTSRAPGCPTEYVRMKRGWDALLRPYWKGETDSLSTHRDSPREGGAPPTVSVFPAFSGH